MCRRAVGTGQISGGFTAGVAKDLAERLSSGEARLEIEIVDN